MKTIEVRQYEMLARVREFGEKHRDLFPEGSLGRAKFLEVADIVTQLNDHAVSRLVAGNGGVTNRASAREALIDRLDAMWRTARAIGEDDGSIGDVFVPIDPSPSDQALLTVGRLYVREAAQYTKAFIDHGMADTFVTELQAEVDRLDEAVRIRQAGKDDHTAARVYIETALDIGLAAVRRLDVIVGNRCRTDRAAMAVWKRDRRISYPRPKPAKRTEEPAAATPASPAPAAPPVAPASAPAARVS